MLNYTCCDFKKLENEYVNYRKEEKQLESKIESNVKPTTPESTEQTTKEPTHTAEEIVEIAAVEEEMVEPVTSPQQEVAATTDQSTTDQPSSNKD